MKTKLLTLTKNFSLLTLILLAGCGGSGGYGGGGGMSSLCPGGIIASATLAAPQGVSAVASTTTKREITVSWSAVMGATSYNLYMASASGVTKSNWCTLSGGMQHTGVTSPFVHTGLTSGVTYYFVVTAVNVVNGIAYEGPDSAQVQATAM